MKTMKVLFLMATTMFVLYGSASALSIDVYNATDKASINSWIASHGGQVVVLEDFEGNDIATDWYGSFVSSALGTFSAAGSPGAGATSYNTYLTKLNGTPSSSDAPYFSIRDEAWYGRGNTTVGGERYLDSGDITELDLTISATLTNLFFYIQDPSDCGAKTTVESETLTYNFLPDEFHNDKDLFFVGISSENALKTISWSTTTNGDGYGLDDFSTTTAPVPEPATLFLLGSGLLGVAGLKRKKQINK